MQNKILTQSLSTFRIVLISSLTIFTLYTVQAWVSPTVSAPNGNVGGPLTTATSTQIKTGSLGLLDSLSIGNNLIVNGAFRFATTSAGIGKVLMSDATGNASWQAVVAGGIGVGQTWQNVKSSRVFSTTYTNSTGKPIFVSVSTSNTGTCQMWLYVDSILVGYDSDSNGGFAGSCGGLDAIVPNGSTYSVTGRSGSTLYSWAELR